MKHVEVTVPVLHELKHLGVQLAVDDFDTGHSILSCLREFPIDILKIDRSFIKQIGFKKDDAILVSAIIGMGHSLKYVVVAEGIETKEQIAHLEAQHCAEGQGFYLALLCLLPASLSYSNQEFRCNCSVSGLLFE